MRILFLSLLTVLSLTACHEGEAKDGATVSGNTKPYKATTVDECINEKECVWYHFLLAIQASPLENKASKDINIKKWHKQVRIRIAGLNKDKNKIFLDKYLRQLLPYIPQDFAITDKYNYLIMSTDSIEHELANEFSSTFESMFGKNIILDAYKKSSDKKCYFTHLQSDKENYSINSYFAFIQSDHPNPELCFKDIFYAGFGPSNIADSNIWNSYKVTDKYSNLELFIMFILNTEYIKQGMSYEQLGQAFNHAYKDAINFIKVTGGFNKA